MACVFIRDGWTLKGSVQAKTGWWPKISITYRPALPGPAYEFIDNPTRTGKGRLKVTCDFIRSHLVSWDAADADGAPVDHLAPNVLEKVHRAILDDVVAMILSHGPDIEEAEKN
jgi:hypothetical protein